MVLHPLDVQPILLRFPLTNPVSSITNIPYRPKNGRARICFEHMLSGIVVSRTSTEVGQRLRGESHDKHAFMFTRSSRHFSYHGLFVSWPKPKIVGNKRNTIKRQTYLAGPSLLAQLRSARWPGHLRTSLVMMRVVLSFSTFRSALLLLVQKSGKARSKRAVTDMSEPAAGHNRIPSLCCLQLLSGTGLKRGGIRGVATWIDLHTYIAAFLCLRTPLIIA